MSKLLTNKKGDNCLPFLKTPANNALPLKDYLKHRQLSIPNLDVYHRPHHSHQNMVRYELSLIGRKHSIQQKS